MPDESLSPQLIIHAYLQGAFPMADHRAGEVNWYQPHERAVLPLDAFHVRRSLRRQLNKDAMRCTRDRDFGGVIRGCAEPRPDDPETWISEEIIRAYTRLHELGVAHSVEVYASDDAERANLLGGVYGLAIGGAFLAESMFSRVPWASQVALVQLVGHLRGQGFVLLDAQLWNPHLDQFGAQQITHDAYMHRLHEAVQLDVTF